MRLCLPPTEWVDEIVHNYDITLFDAEDIEVYLTLIRLCHSDKALQKNIIDLVGMKLGPAATEQEKYCCNAHVLENVDKLRSLIHVTGLKRPAVICVIGDKIIIGEEKGLVDESEFAGLRHRRPTF
jgi:hypothetical protein